jgi:hypothetical protein
MPTQLPLAIVPPGFSYSPLDRPTADRLRSAAVRIRAKIKRTLQDIIDVGNELRAAKAVLARGQFGPWLRAEFGWSERTARNFMAVAERFGPKTAMIADSAISPTAAYLLASPSAPDAARRAALDQAEAGRPVTVAVARDLLNKARKKAGAKPVLLPAEQLTRHLGKLLELYRVRWSPERLDDMARQLRQFADKLERSAQGKQRGRA